MSRAFDWVSFANGRARFTGKIRGWDDSGHDTFAVAIEDHIFYGEVDRHFADNTMFVEFSNFGYLNREDVGIATGRHRFTIGEASLIEDLTRALVVTVDGYDKFDKPVSLMTIGNTVFSGDVVFDSDWIAVTDG